MTTSIRSLPFRHNLKPGVGFEIFKLSELYRRRARGAIDHALDVPQRPQFHTIYVGLRGRGRHVVDFAPVALGAGVLTICAAGRVQQFTPARTAEAWMLLLSPELLARASVPAILSPAWTQPAIAMTATAARDVLAICDQLAAEQARPLDDQQVPLFASLAAAVLLHAERLAARAHPPHSSSEIIDRFVAALERDHARTRAVAHYARAAGVSARRLEELLAPSGRTPKQMICERVVLEHKRLLAHTEISVKELAALTGFAEPTNLVKFFRHHAGTTPLEFRARIRAHRAF